MSSGRKFVVTKTKQGRLLTASEFATLITLTEKDFAGTRHLSLTREEIAKLAKEFPVDTDTYVVELLREAILHIEYLEEKFNAGTGSGETVKSQIRSFLDRQEAM